MGSPASAASSTGLIIKPWKIRMNIRSLCALFIAIFIICALYASTTSDNNNRLVHQLQEDDSSPQKKSSSFSDSSCNLFSGTWVFDDTNSPLYREKQCSFMIDDYACEKYGRKDFKYQQWRWQPHGCDLPRFNAKRMLEKLRGKRMLFVGDSLNKNQWISLLCLIESALPLSSKSPEWKGSLITFKAIEYNATIDFYWEPLLVESNCDDAIEHHIKDRIIRVNAIEKHAKHWTDADILVFDSYMWWLNPNMTILRGSFEDPEHSKFKKEARTPHHFKMALRTWSDWLVFNINRTRTKMFYMSLSPFHFLGDDWGAEPGENCYGETEPITNEDYWGRCAEKPLMQTAEAAIEELETIGGLKIEYINITQMSDRRKDGHPSIYRKHFMSPTKEQSLDPKSYADCVHWCLPGVPDVWNQLLYAYIMNS